MYVDGIGTVGGALLGTTSIITYVESAIGIHAGGRTGIVAIVCRLLMLLSLIFTPLVAYGSSSRNFRSSHFCWICAFAKRRVAFGSIRHI